MPSQFETIEVSSDGGIATITLNRPEKKNAMNPQMHREMNDCLESLAYDEDLRVLVITGAGDSFSAGMDLNEYFVALSGNLREKERVFRLSEWRSHRLRLFPVPTIAAVNGWCFGGAFSIVGSCDIVVAADEATFGLSEINFGKIAGGYVSKSISEVMTMRDAMYYLLTGETFDGRKAAEMRLATFSVPRDQLAAKVNEIATRISAHHPLVARATKEAFRFARTMDWEEAGAWLAAKSQSLDFQTGSTWKAGVKQFNQSELRPGLGAYDWEKGEE